MTATNELNRALLSLALPVTDPATTRELWTAEHAAERALAVKWCRGCEVRQLCAEAAEERDERWGVWGGVDRSTRPEKKAA